jgi:diguanylate cyclase (GGDEF)-like protein/PAS domain S-box-containing protein
MSKAAVKRLLVVEDNPGDARLLREMFDERGPASHITTMTHVESLLEAEKCLSTGEVDVILLDLGLPDANGITAVRRTQAAAPRVPMVVLTGLDDDELAAQALNEGAQDYLIKGQIEGSALFRSLRYAIERKIMEETLFAEKERAQVTLRSIGEGVICADILGNVTFLNLVAEQATGWSLQEASGRPMVEVFRTRENVGGDSLETTAEVAIMQIRAMHLPSTCVLIRRDGVAIPIEESIAPIHNREGKAIGAVIVFRDVSAARATALQIAHSAQHDFLTGLPNRMLLNDRIDQAIIMARRSRMQVAVLFLDLDGFKHINDSLGHPVGDKLLKSIAQRLVKCVRSTDTVSRQGGDEFVVLLSGVNRPNAAAVTAAKLLESVAKTHSIDQHELHVTASIGVSAYPDDGLNAETLIKNADTAMYQMKENGRQGFRFLTAAMNARAVERQSIEESLRRALLRNELTLHYQPVICLKTRQIVGAEALIRWKHPTRGPLSPAQFIPIAEDCGLIVPIGRWVLREACRQARAWIDSGYPAIRMAVNVSAIELSEAHFLKGVLAIVRDTGMQPGLLELELTESVLMKRVDSTVAILKTLRDKGVLVAVDDFGTGYSSLSYLRKFPIDILKIDQSFVRQTGAGGEDAAIVTAVISMARSLKLRVVAEGVETKAELKFLQAQQCDDAQGFYFSKPVPAGEFVRLLMRGASKEAPPRLAASPAVNGHDTAPVSAESSGVSIRSIGENLPCR